VMKKYQYQVTIERVIDEAEVETPLERIQFNVQSHDEIFQVIEKARARDDFSSGHTEAFVVGLKLLGGVLLENKNHFLLSDFSKQFGEFMKKLKSSSHHR
jgi:hypothetical protein